MGNGLLIALAVVYLLIGIVVYMTADVNDLESRLESYLPIGSLPSFEKYLFLVIVAFWPIWLAAAPFLKIRRGPF